MSVPKLYKYRIFLVLVAILSYFSVLVIFNYFQNGSPNLMPTTSTETVLSKVPPLRQPDVTCLSPIGDSLPDSGVVARMSMQSFPIIDEKSQEYWKRVVLLELSKYGPTDWSNQIETIYIVDRLFIGNVPVGGTFFRKSIFIAVNDHGGPLDDYFVCSTLHHEIAGVLCAVNDKTDLDKQFKSLSGPYIGRDPLEVIRESSHRLGTIDPRLFAKGFLTDYGSINPMKDMCTIHERLMMSPERLRIVAEENPGICQKLVLWLNFVKSRSVHLEPRFDITKLSCASSDP